MNAGFLEGVLIRPIASGDNAAMALIIRNSLEEFNANRPGTVYFDASTDHLFELFQTEKNSSYFVAEKDGVLLGGAGIYPTNGLPAHTCELVKMYLSPAARGLGLGKKMIAKCLQTAADAGFGAVYLETMPELKQAVTVYQKFGFHFLPAPMGNSGHNGCDIWMLKEL